MCLNNFYQILKKICVLYILFENIKEQNKLKTHLKQMIEV